MILGITGGTGCGKTTLLDVVRELGGLVLDCDSIYHQLLNRDPHLLSVIASRFPDTVTSHGLDRKKLGNIVFHDSTALADLNHITHSAVRKEVERRLNHAPDLVAVDAIALFESGLDGLCDFTVAITASQEARIARIMARDNLSREYALARIQAQPSSQEFATRCDYLLENNDTLPAFREKCLVFFAQLGIMKENCKGE